MIQIENTDDLFKQGVYCILNTINGKRYIGSTLQTFNRRFIQHKSLLNTNKHHNPHLQKAWNKYGANNFTFIILEITCKENCRIKEREYIETTKSFDSTKGYNIEIDTTKETVLEKTKLKISNTLKEGFRSGRIPLPKHRFKKGFSTWNKGLQCPNIGLSRRKMFNSVNVYSCSKLICTFRSVIDLAEWSELNEMPGLIYTPCNKKGHILRRDKIYFAIRNNILYKGLKFELTRPLLPEMGVANWMNSENAEMPTLSQAQDTSCEGATTT